MKSLKKLFLCILVSILIANFIIMGATIIAITFDHPTSSIEIFKSKISENQLKEQYKEFENKMIQVKESNPEQYDADFPIYGMFATILPLTVLGPMVSMYILSIIVGIVVGLMVYLIFIENKKGKQAIIAFTICFGITILLYKCLMVISELTSNLIYTQYEEYEWYQLFVGYVITFVVLYIGNMIYQKRITKKLNKKLEHTK